MITQSLTLNKDFYNAVREGNIKQLEIFVSQHPELLNTRDVMHGDNLLQQLVESYIEDKIDWALGHGIDINDRNKIGQTALHIAADLDDGHMVDHLVLRGANIEARNDNDETPLMVAVALGCEMSMDYLIKHGADTKTIACDGHSILTAFLCSEHYKDWDQAVATSERLQTMIEADPEWAMASWAMISEDPKLLKLSKKSFPELACSLEALWLRKQQPDTILQAPSRPRF